MFRKLVSNLPYSPALIHEVGFYAHRLKKEDTTRQLTVIFTILALIVQSLAVFSPPESANASSDQDLIRGGISGKQDFLARYDANDANIKDIYSAAGISREEIDATTDGKVDSKTDALIMGRHAQFGEKQGEIMFSYNKTDTGETNVTYISPLKLWDTSVLMREKGTTYSALIGKSSKIGWFGIIKSNGNLVTKTLPPGAINLSSSIKENITAINLTQTNAPAESSNAEPGDRISYTIIAQNKGKEVRPVPLTVPLGDILEYAKVIDNGGGVIDEETETLTWPPVSLAVDENQQRTFVVQLNDPVPATPTGTSNSASFDCIITTSFGTSTAVPIACPTAKVVETTAHLLPTTGTMANIIFAIVTTSTVTYFYFRTRQLKKEIRLIRHTLNTGSL